MKVAVVADVHFDEYLNLSRGESVGISSRLSDVADAWRWSVDVASKKGCERYVVCGDLYNDRSSLTLPVLHAAGACIKYASDRMRTVLIAGNHDAYLRDSTISGLSMAVAKSVRVVLDAHTDGALGFVGWHDNAAVISKRCKRVSGEGAKFLFSHGLLNGAVPTRGGLSPSAFHPKLFHRVLLGDVHDRMRISDRIDYVGGLLPLDFRDADKVRGFAILDTDTHEVEWVDNTRSPRFTIITDDSEFELLGKKDYARVEPSCNISRTAVDQMRLKDFWVEGAKAVTEGDRAVRIKFDDALDSGKVIAEYTSFVGESGDTRLVNVGKALLRGVLK